MQYVTLPVSKRLSGCALLALLHVGVCAEAAQAQDSSRPDSRNAALFEHAPESWHILSKATKYKVDYLRYSGGVDLLPLVDKEQTAEIGTFIRCLTDGSSSSVTSVVDLRAMWSSMLARGAMPNLTTLQVQAEVASSSETSLQRTTRSGNVERVIVRTADMEVSRDPLNAQVTVSRRTFIVFDLPTIAGPLPIRRLSVLEAHEWKRSLGNSGARSALIARPKDLPKIKTVFLMMDPTLSELPQVYVTVMASGDYVIAQYSFGVTDGASPSVVLTGVLRLTQGQGKWALERIECSSHEFPVGPDEFRLAVQSDDVFVDARVAPPRSRKGIERCPKDARELVRLSAIGK